MEEFASVMRRLWKGEAIFGYEGPLGSFPVLSLDGRFDFDIPLALVAFGENSLALGGRAFDDVILHTYFTNETLVRSVQTVKRAAEEAGRDPSSVRVWSCFATIGDHLPEDLRLKKSVGRLATYLQGYGDLLVRTNGWDPAVLERFRADPVVGSMAGAIDSVATTAQLEQIAELIPEEWLAPSASGSPAQCAAKVQGQLTLGADAVIMHGRVAGRTQPDSRGLPLGRRLSAAVVAGRTEIPLRRRPTVDVPDEPHVGAITDQVAEAGLERLHQLRR